MSLTFDEKIEIELKKIAELKRKKKAEQERSALAVGRKLLELIPEITSENFDVVLAQYVMAAKVSEAEQDCLNLGRLLREKMPQYFASGGIEAYKNNIDKIAEIIEKMD